MSVSFTAAAIPNLPDHQSALVLDTGEIFIVEITSAPISPDDAAHWVALHVRAWQVDETGAPVMNGDKPTEIPPFTSTVALAGLADGLTTINDVIAQATAKAAQHFKNYLTAIEALRGIPPGTNVRAVQQMSPAIVG